MIQTKWGLLTIRVVYPVLILIRERSVQYRVYEATPDVKQKQRHESKLRLRRHGQGVRRLGVRVCFCSWSMISLAIELLERGYLVNRFCFCFGISVVAVCLIYE
jgi:hypothetical protein